MEYFRVTENTNLKMLQPTTPNTVIDKPDFLYDNPTDNDRVSDNTVLPGVPTLTEAQVKQYKGMVAFNVTLPTQSTVKARPTSVSAGDELETVTLTYTVPG